MGSIPVRFFLILTLVISGESLFASQTRDPEACGRFLGLLKTLGFIERKPHYKKFEHAYNRYNRHFFSEGKLPVALEDKPSREAKVAAIFVALERLTNSQIFESREQAHEMLDFVLRRSALKDNAIFRYEEARQIINSIFYFLVRKSEPGSKSPIVRWLRKDLEPDLAGTFANQVSGSPQASDFLNRLVELHLLREQSLFETWRHWLSKGRNTKGIVSAVLLNGVLFHLGIPIPYAPDVHPVDFPLLPDEALRLSMNDRVRTRMIPMLHEKWAPWIMGHRIYRGSRRVYLTGLGVASALYLALQPQLVVATFDYLKLSATMRWMSIEDFRRYEQKNYQSVAVVEEQLMMWLDAQDPRPAREVIEAKRREFQDQEARGVLRVFKP